MTIQEIIDDAFERMDRSNEHTKEELHKVRTGKASPSMLDSIKIDYYGTLSPLSQVATINVPEPRLITVKPWDRSMVTLIDNTIRNSNLGFNPSNDGTLVRVPIPELTTERREQFVKQSHRIIEDGKIAVRNVRRDANDHIKKLEKTHEISEDEAKKSLDEIQSMTDLHVDALSKLLAEKEIELREI